MISYKKIFHGFIWLLFFSFLVLYFAQAGGYFEDLNNKKGWKKYKGSIEENESLITKENGFKNIHELKPGENPLGFIEILDNKYLASLNN